MPDSTDASLIELLQVRRAGKPVAGGIKFVRGKLVMTAAPPHYDEFVLVGGVSEIRFPVAVAIGPRALRSRAPADDLWIEFPVRCPIVDDPASVTVAIAIRVRQGAVVVRELIIGDAPVIHDGTVSWGDLGDHLQGPPGDSRKVTVDRPKSRGNEGRRPGPPPFGRWSGAGGIVSSLIGTEDGQRQGPLTIRFRAVTGTANPGEGFISVLEPRFSCRVRADHGRLFNVAVDFLPPPEGGAAHVELRARRRTPRDPEFSAEWIVQASMRLATAAVLNIWDTRCATVANQAFRFAGGDGISWVPMSEDGNPRDTTGFPWCATFLLVDRTDGRQWPAVGPTPGIDVGSGGLTLTHPVVECVARPNDSVVFRVQVPGVATASDSTVAWSGVLRRRGAIAEEDEDYDFPARDELWPVEDLKGRADSESRVIAVTPATKMETANSESPDLYLLGDALEGDGELTKQMRAWSSPAEGGRRGQRTRGLGGGIILSGRHLKPGTPKPPGATRTSTAPTSASPVTAQAQPAPDELQRLTLGDIELALPAFPTDRSSGRLVEYVRTSRVLVLRKGVAFHYSNDLRYAVGHVVRVRGPKDDPDTWHEAGIVAASGRVLSEDTFLTVDRDLPSGPGDKGAVPNARYRVIAAVPVDETRPFVLAAAFEMDRHPDDSGHTGEPEPFLAAVELRARVAVAAAAAATSPGSAADFPDSLVPPDDEAPLVLDVNPESVQGQASILDVSERVESRGTHRLLARWRALPRDGAPPVHQTVVIRHRPFALFAMQHTLGAPSDPTGIATVGTFDFQNGRPRWRLPYDTDTAAAGAAAAHADINVIFPAQSIGEAFVKGHDQRLGFPGGSVTDARGRARPVLSDTRFSPPALARLRDSALRRELYQPPWREGFFGVAGDEAPGALLRRLQFELLYGLNNDVEVPDAFLRLVELDAVVGLPVGTESLPGQLEWVPGSREAEDAFQTVRSYVRRTVAGIRARPQILFVRNERLPRLTLTGNVTFHLRHYYKPEAWEVAGGPAQPPRIKTVRSPFLDRAAEESLCATELGLPGGSLWGVEQPPFYQRLSELTGPANRSDGGRLADPYVTPLGGGGRQRAEFLGGSAAIESVTDLGRTSAYSVEIRGRIGTLWNRAKHVVVYERTVVPSPQFARDQGRLPDTSGAAVVRKVREYVEILEAERHFPESGVAPEARGPVTASVFRRTQIPVDSAWAHQVGQAGWAVPLWRRDADPRIYPKPQVILRLASATADGVPLMAEVDEPEKLVFYTQVDSEPDTDRWPAVPGVDFADVPDPEPEKFTALDDAAPDRILGDALPKPTGLDPFTWVLLPAGRPANVVAGRDLKPIVAELQCVTMARAAPIRSTALPPGPPPLGAIGAVARAADDVRSTLSEIRQTVSELNGASEAAVRSAQAGIEKRLSDLLGLRPDVKSKVEALFGGKSPADRLKQIVDDWATRARAAVAIAASVLRSDLAAAESLTKEQVELVRQQLRSAVARFDRTIRTSASLPGLAATKVLEAIAAPRITVTRWRSAVRRGDSWRNLKESQLRAVIAEQLDAARQLQADVARFRIPAEVRDKFVRAIDAWAQVLTNTSANVDDLITASGVVVAEADVLLAAIDKVIEGVQAGAAAAAADLCNAVASAATIATDAVDQTRAAIGATVDAATTEQVTQAAQNLREHIDDIQQTLNNRINETQKALNALIDKLKLDPAALASQAMKDLGFDDAKDLLTHVQEFGRAGWNEARNMAVALADGLRQRLAAAGIDDVVHTGREFIGQATDAYQRGSSAIRLVRAVGTAPLGPGMGFNRKTIAYFFADPTRIKTTPVAALFDTASAQLKAFGFRLPTKELADRLLPDLSNLRLGNLFPDFGGLRLADFLDRLKVPTSLDEKGVKVAHGIDRQTLRAWVRVNIDVAFGNLTLFSRGPLSMRLLNPRLVAASEVVAEPGRPPRVTKSGSIVASWPVTVGGMEIVRFVDTALRYDENGKLSFDVSPNKIRLTGVLAAISTLLPKSDEGSVLRPIKDGDAVIGVEARISLALPDIGGGVFLLRGVQLGAGMGVAVPALSGSGKGFKVFAGFNLSTRESPFALTLLFLGGAGYLDVAVSYNPITRQLGYTVDVGVFAAASIAFSLGPVSGGVYVYLGITAFLAREGSSNVLMITAELRIEGRVSVLGIVSIYIGIILQFAYKSVAGSSSLIARGTLAVSVKIGWFFRIRFRKTVTYEFQTGSAPPKLDEGTEEHVEMLT